MTRPGPANGDAGERIWRGGFTTRAGGASSGEYGTLNLAYHVGDEAALVARNRRALEAELGCEVVWMSQIHSDIWKDASTATRSPSGSLGVGEADALILDAATAPATGYAIAVIVADCIPLLLLDSTGQRGAAVHVGRAGLDSAIALRVLAELERRGSSAANIRAVIGPHICGSCYEVPATMADDVGARWPQARSTTSWGTPALDLGRALADQLASRGVAHVDDMGICTLGDEQYYSHRRSGKVHRPAGRFAGILALTPQRRSTGH